jgi:hypothetical protein
MKFQNVCLIIILLFFALIINSCKNNHNNNPVDNWVEITDTSSIFIHCLDFDKIKHIGKIIIRNQDEYDNLDTLKAKPPLYPNCINYEKPEIDFTKYSLLGCITLTGPFNIIRHVYINVPEKKYLYKINITITSNESILYINYNLMLLPKIPPDYEIEIDKTIKNPYY